MSDARCQHCGKTESEHPLLLITNPPTPICHTIDAIQAINKLSKFSPIVPPPAPFQVGDWVVSCTIADKRPVCIDEVRGEMFWYQRDGERVWDHAKNLRRASPEEIRAVTHFRPKVAMLLRAKVAEGVHAVVWRLIQINSAMDSDGRYLVNAINLSGPSAGMTSAKWSFAQADWTVLDSYTVQGVPHD